ncbi:MAG: hypothetical protein LUC88_04590 [Prevotella sp.]|nr:hypothetical protein [Prevotella sp.]
MRFLQYIRRMKAEHVSIRVLYILIAITVLLFGAFFIIGFDKPYSEDPSFNAPLLTDAVLLFVYFLIAAALSIMAYSVVRSIKRRDKSANVINNIPESKILWCTVALLLCCMILTFLLGSSQPVYVNGVEFAQVFWLKSTDMFINTIIVMLVVAVLGVLFGVSGYSRKIRLNK